MAEFILKHGPRSELPSSLAEGDHYIVTSDGGNPVSPPELYVGPDGGGTPEPLSRGKMFRGIIEWDESSGQGSIVDEYINQIDGFSISFASGGRITFEDSTGLVKSNTFANGSIMDLSGGSLTFEANGLLLVEWSDYSSNDWRASLEVVKY